MIGNEKTVMLWNDMINCNFDSRTEVGLARRESGLLDRSASAVELARRSRIPIIWITVRDFWGNHGEEDEASPLWEKTRPARSKCWNTQNVPELSRAPQDEIVVKVGLDPFYASNLSHVLRSLGAEEILLGGISTTYGVESALRSARDRNFKVTVLSDCTFADEVEEHQEALLKRFPRFGRVLAASEAISGYAGIDG